MKRVLMGLMMIFIMTGIVACQQQTMDDSSDMIGVVEDVRFDSEGTFTNILVKGDTESETGELLIDYGWAMINESTTVYVNGEEVDFYPFTDLENITVEVLYDGEIMESYPVQGTAKIVRIFENEK